MANIRSQIKRIKVSERQNERNKTVRSEIKTQISKFQAAVKKKDKKLAEETYKEAVKVLDSASAKGIIHRNNAANKKSALAKLRSTLS